MTDPRRKSAARTVTKMKQTVEKIRSRKIKAEAESVHPVDVYYFYVFTNGWMFKFIALCFSLQCCLWDFRYGSTTVGNVYEGVLVEPLHQSDQGLHLSFSWKIFIPSIHILCVFLWKVFFEG